MELRRLWTLWEEKKSSILLPVASDRQKRDLLSAHARMLIKEHCWGLGRLPGAEVEILGGKQVIG